MESPEEHGRDLRGRNYRYCNDRDEENKRDLRFQSIVKIGKKHFQFEVKQFTLGADANEERTDKLARQIIRIVEETRKRSRGSKE